MSFSVFILHPSSFHWSGHWDSNPEPCADLALTPLIRRLLYRLSYAPKRSFVFRVQSFEFVYLRSPTLELPALYWNSKRNAKLETRNSKLIFWSRWKELNRHRSIINRVLWAIELHRERSFELRVSCFELIVDLNSKLRTRNSKLSLVGPAGLKPAPHGLKGRYSVTRVPGQYIADFQLPIADC